MAKCKCKTKPRIVSSVVKAMNGCGSGSGCRDVCANPICGEPNQLSILAPLIYDEIGINLCTTFELGVDIATTYPNVTNASIGVVDATYTVGDGGVTIEAITGRKNCYVVTLTDITIRFAMNLYDSACRYVATIYPTAVYLPSTTDAPTYDEDTNPTSVELEIFAPYGLAYDTTGATPTPTLNFIGLSTENNLIRQGINLSSMAKILDFSTDDSTATVGITLFLQSLYYSGYKVNSAGKIDTPKGSVITPDNSDCMRFVAGDLLNLAIKPLDLGPYTKAYKQPCCDEEDCCTNCNNCGVQDGCENECSNGATDDTVEITQEATP